MAGEAGGGQGGLPAQCVRHVDAETGPCHLVQVQQKITDLEEEKDRGCDNESMASLVLRQYMRGENVLLIQIGKQNVKIIEK